MPWMAVFRSARLFFLGKGATQGQPRWGCSILAGAVLSTYCGGNYLPRRRPAPQRHRPHLRTPFGPPLIMAKKLRLRRLKEGSRTWQAFTHHSKAGRSDRAHVSPRQAVYRTKTGAYRGLQALKFGPDKLNRSFLDIRYFNNCGNRHTTLRKDVQRQPSARSPIFTDLWVPR